MIAANLATYPPRISFLPRVVAAIAPQVDSLNVVLNEYEAVPDFLRGYDNVRPLLPEHDTMATGKFYPDTGDAEYVLLVDDDVIYPDDFVARSLAEFQSLDVPRAVAGHHCSIFERPAPALSVEGMRNYLRFHLRPSRIPSYRRILHFGLEIPDPVHVDQVATNACILRTEDMPPYDYMRTAIKFVDIRLARWCFEQSITPVCLPHEKDWLLPCEAVGVAFDETIVKDFLAKHPPQVAREIWQYAFRRDNLGTPVPRTPRAA